ncbi:periplasmic component of the Tol biopolymer transport system [Rheinheimera sp. A13L]|uniref:TolB family protein n=1 Tax=Rheinheimera sp. A13L TaxID=506534 RepID=UPI0002124B04|nr:PD40 domain-containing protein [Rheinheimera sp. A13L]EGM76254.1 periplasmic component of the Tol biopolymer transport system [Rheinheimera sp. A13L]
MRLLSLALAVMVFPLAAALPQYNLYLTDLSENLSVSNQVKINETPTYINQPAFSKDGKSLFFTLEQGKDAAVQTDVGLYLISDKKQQLLTKTSLSEYSPTLLPDGSGLSLVAVEADQTQRLWAVDWQGNTGLLKAEPKGVGYHAWGPHQDLLLFILGDKEDNHTVRYLDKDGNLTTLATGVGRALSWQPGTQKGFYTQAKQGQLFLSSYDVKTKTNIQTELALPAGGQDLVWWSEEKLLVSAGTKIYQWQVQGKQEWNLWLDLSKECGTEISRFALNKARSQLAFVCKA